jgi:hypothetical protein
MLGMDVIEWSPANKNGKSMKRTLFDVIKATPHLFFRGMAALAYAFDAEGERSFRVVPVRSSLSPRFISLDQTVLNASGLVDADTKLRLQKAAEIRRKAKLPFEERLKDAKRQLAAAKSEWKQADLERNAHLKKGEKRIKPLDEELERRATVEKELNDHIGAIKSDPAYVALCDDAETEKRAAFEAVFDLTRSEDGRTRLEGGRALSEQDAARWAFSMKTDGVSVRVLLKEKPTRASKRGRDGRRALPRRGLITIERLRESLFGSEPPPTLDSSTVEELDGLSAQEQNEVLNDVLAGVCELPTIVGGDPGMRELLRLCNPDLTWTDRRERDKVRNAFGDVKDWQAWCEQLRCGYNLVQRREEKASARYFLKKRHENDPARKQKADSARAYRHAHVHAPEAVLEAERSLSAYNSNGPTAAKLLEYARARSAVLPTLLPWYTDRQRRVLRWKRFISEQRSFSQFCNRIRKMMQQREKPLVIAYGAKGMSNGLVVKGLPPCINTGLRKKLSREFLVVAVPEHYTSQRCFHCKSECSNHKYLAERDRRAASDERLEVRLVDRLRRAETSVQRQNARAWCDRAMSRPCEIRGLRFCSGCKRCLNRDANSAPQMAVQLKRMLLGIGPLYKQDKKEVQTEKLEAELGTL